MKPISNTDTEEEDPVHDAEPAYVQGIFALIGDAGEDNDKLLTSGKYTTTTGADAASNRASHGEPSAGVFGLNPAAPIWQPAASTSDRALHSAPTANSHQAPSHMNPAGIEQLISPLSLGAISDSTTRPWWLENGIPPTDLNLRSVILETHSRIQESSRNTKYVLAEVASALYPYVHPRSNVYGQASNLGSSAEVNWFAFRDRKRLLSALDAYADTVREKRPEALEAPGGEGGSTASSSIESFGAQQAFEAVAKLFDLGSEMDFRPQLQNSRVMRERGRQRGLQKRIGTRSQVSSLLALQKALMEVEERDRKMTRGGDGQGGSS